MTAAADLPCPLCPGTDTTPYFEDSRRSYRQCECCRLVFVEARYHLDAVREKAEYDLHRNSPTDEGYRHFLSRLATPLLQRLPAASQGLDFGCGPGPTLSLMLEEAGHNVDLFDIYYANNDSVWQRRYRFITATEVVEHLAHPGAELQRLWHLLEPGGTLALMTKLVIDRERFARWHYKNDPTHISFFCRETFAWLCSQWHTSAEFIGQDVILIDKPMDKPTDS